MYATVCNFSKCSIDAHNNPLTDEALAAAKSADAIILGAVGGPVRTRYFIYSEYDLIYGIEMGNRQGAP